MTSHYRTRRLAIAALTAVIVVGLAACSTTVPNTTLEPKTEFGRAIRNRFLLDPGITFLNHGSFGTIPRDVYAAAGGGQDAWPTPDSEVSCALQPPLHPCAGRRNASSVAS